MDEKEEIKRRPQETNNFRALSSNHLLLDAFRCLQTVAFCVSPKFTFVTTGRVAPREAYSAIVGSKQCLVNQFYKNAFYL